MELKYINYSVEELVDDKMFVAWVLEGRKDREWKSFIEVNSKFKSIAIDAREIVLLLRDTEELLDENEVSEMWQKTEEFYYKQEKKDKTVKIWRNLYRAASVFIVLSIGTLGYVYFGKKSSGYQFASSENHDAVEEVRVLFSDGEEISLKSKNTTLSINDDYTLTLNNDSIIDLSQKEIEAGKKVQMNEIIVPYGKKSELILADGTKVWLNAGTHFAFPTRFIDDSREVFLEGEAYFEVVENMDKPFIVNVNKLNIRVLGTSFNVSAYPNDDRIETILLTGSVAIGKSRLLGQRRDDVIIKPYQKASFNKQDNEVVVSSEPNADFYITWTEGMFQFSKESLQSVLTKLERFYNVSMSFPENFQSFELISGKLDLKESIADVMMVLGDVAKIEYRINENIIFVDKKK